jgi:hypothetical protein
MSNDESISPTDAGGDDAPETDEELDLGGEVAPETDEELDLVSYDLNDDGKISPIEGARFELGIADARLEELAEQPGLKGKIADVAHHLLDKLDND